MALLKTRLARRAARTTMISGLALFAILLQISLRPESTPRIARAQSNPIVIENQQAGTGQWDYGLSSDDPTGQIKGYATATSVSPGGQIGFKISVSPAQSYSIGIYRMGWYGGTGGRLMQTIGPLNGTKQTSCPQNASTGMVECNWATAYTLNVPANWTSGIYLAKLTNASNFQNYIIFTVRDNRPADFLYIQPVTTYQAYNAYPRDAYGKSLYEFSSSSPFTVVGSSRAAKVSFDRPYMEEGTGQYLNTASSGEQYLVRWLEKMGYDVTYATDIDLQDGAVSLTNYKGVLFGGHDEYWAKTMFDRAEAARDAGVNLAFFAANEAYWQVRFENGIGGANRVMICYKDAGVDPETNSALKTILWRDVGRPEQTLIGVQYSTYNSYVLNTPLIIQNSDYWVYQGSGLSNGSSVPGIVGYEIDRQHTEYPLPANTTYSLISRSPFTDYANQSDNSNAVVYQAPSGAWVFGSGTISWAWALDKDGVTDSRIQKTTQNLLDRFRQSGAPVPTRTPSAPTATNTPVPPASTSTNTPVAPNPTATATAAATPSSGNLALSATAYRWYGMTASTLNAPRVAATGLNNGNLTDDVKLSDAAVEAENVWEAAGVVWTTNQSVSQVRYVNGTRDAGLDGVFGGNFKLQFSTDGTTWVDSGWAATPAYGYDSPAASGTTYTFSGAAVTGIRGVRVIGQVHVLAVGSWFVNTREVEAYGSGSSATATATPISAPTSAAPTNTPAGPTPTRTPTASPTAIATPASGNLATSATAYRWFGMAASNLNATRTAAAGLNDGNLTTDVKLTDSGDVANAWEAAGVVWATAQTIGQVSFINGSYDSVADGVFVQNLKVQLSTDGATWTDTNWAVTPAYSYDSSASAGKTYTFSGQPIAGVRGARVVGQVHVDPYSSWFVRVREVLAYSGSGPAVTATPAPPATATAIPTATPLPAAFEVKVNFQPAAAAVPAGYKVDSGAAFANRGNGYSYGWNATNNRAVDRNSTRSPDQRFDTNIPMQTGGTYRWELAVPNGTYQVMVVAGDPTITSASYRINAESTLIVNGTANANTRWYTGTMNIVVSDGRLTLSSATGASGNRLAFVEVRTATGATVAQADAGDSTHAQTSAQTTAEMEQEARVQRVTRQASFTAHVEPNGIRLLWTEGKMRFAGFRIYRSTTGDRTDAVELTPMMMRSQGSVDAPYGFLDDTAQPNVAYSYWLSFVDGDGSAVEVGSIELQVNPAVENYYFPIIVRQ